MQSKQFGTLIGSFGKGVSGSVTINFGVSGGANCDDSCELKQSGACYAITTEKVKPSITVNLERKENNFNAYLTELNSDKAINKLNNAPWVRFSAFGSIPKPESLSAADIELLSELASKLVNQNMHFPVETIDKGRLLKSIGFNPRISCASDIAKAESLAIQGLNSSLVIAGAKRATGKNKRLYSSEAFAVAKELNSKGVSAKVCPAIAGSAKCGDCKMCADSKISTIIYPLH